MMGAPQIIWIVLASMGVAIHIAKHGQPGKYDAVTQIVATVMAATLLWWGGFFGGAS